MLRDTKRQARARHILKDAQGSPMGSGALAVELALRQRELEINQLTQRNNFFMVFQGVLFSGLIQSQGAAAPVLTFFACFTGLIVSLSQFGVACGAKYWQIRWEQAVKSMEIYMLEVLEGDHSLVYQFFTSDKKYLRHEELERLDRVNKSIVNENDKLKMEDGFIEKRVRDDLFPEGVKHWKSPIRSIVSLFILKKFSVSRAPIHVAIGLVFVWLFLMINCVTINGKSISQKIPVIGFVTLKPDSGRHDTNVMTDDHRLSQAQGKQGAMTKSSTPDRAASAPPESNAAASNLFDERTRITHPSVRPGTANRQGPPSS